MGGTPDPDEPPRRFGQHLFGLTKREPHQAPAQLRAAEKARARHRRHADLLGQPIGELVVRQLRDAGAVCQYIVGALGRRTAEAGVHQRPAQEIPPGPVLVSQPLVVVVPQVSRPTATASWRGAGAPTVRKSCTLRMASVASGGATIVPMRQPVTLNDFDAPLIVMVRSAIPSSVAMGMCFPS